MNTASAERTPSLARRRALFLIAICTGSMLLFLVQPMIARMALPRLGGASSVWNSAMLVYQSLLLAGYGYAHWLGRFAPRRQAAIHLTLFCLAALTLPIGLNAASPRSELDPALWVPWLLLTSIGPLFFVVSAQAPLMQRWFAVSGGGDPYPLYAASNLGSFAGLLAYPLLVEPFMDVGAQSLLWSLGYASVALLVVFCALQLPRNANVAVDNATAESTTADDTAAAPDGKTLLRWVILAAIPSGLMLSSTQHLTTNIAAMPLIWVIPLGLYLLSFSVAFAENRTLADIMTKIAPISLIFAAITAFMGVARSPYGAGVLVLCNLFIISCALHARMFEARPNPKFLTRFYLAMSFGGAIGGVFCALLAPLIFDWTYEHPILLLAAALALKPTAFVSELQQFWSDKRRSRPALIVGLIVVGVAALSTSDLLFPLSFGYKLLIGLGLAAFAFFAFGKRPLYFAALVGVMLSINGAKWIADNMDGRTMRSYFGVYTVRPMGDDATSIVHGTTIHGVQMRDEAYATTPTVYFTRKSGVGLAFTAAPEMFGPNARIDVIGLGAGTMACYAQPGQRWKFYEIDPLVEKIARDTRHFSFISRCKPDLDVEIGDARLLIAEQPANDVDILVIDAFSSDAIPMHLLTTEAFETYRRRLAPNGLLMAHISNSYLDLKPVLAGAARSGWESRMRRYRQVEEGEEHSRFAPSTWIALSRDPATIAALERATGRERWEPLPPYPDFTPWTDSYGSILPLMAARWSPDGD